MIAFVNAAVPLLLLLVTGLIAVALYLRNEVTNLSLRLDDAQKMQKMLLDYMDGNSWQKKRQDNRLTQMYAEHQALKKWCEHEIDVHRSRLDVLEMNENARSAKTEQPKNVAIAAKVSRKPRKVRV